MTAWIASLIVASATAYSPCSSGTRMADGTATRFGSVAVNGLPLHTRIRLTHPIEGRRTFVVRDRGGMRGRMDVDVWLASCRAAVVFGRRRVAYRVLHGRGHA